MTARILVTGGTGTLGRHVVSGLRRAGRNITVLSRSSRATEEGIEYVTGDLLTGDGVERAVDRAELIVHCAGGPKGDDVATRTLVKAASGAGTKHLVYISVVGVERIQLVSAIDRAMFGYFGSKLAAERIVAGSSVPWTTLRATQFHELLLTVARQMARMPVIPVPAGFKFQPIDASEVAARLVELALGEPAGLVPEMGGPKVHAMSELVRGYLREHGKRRAIIPIWIPGKAAHAFRSGANLTPDRAVGRRTWEESLEARTNTPRPANLHGLSDYQLSDIGVSREQESYRPRGDNSEDKRS